MLAGGLTSLALAQLTRWPRLETRGMNIAVKMKLNAVIMSSLWWGCSIYRRYLPHCSMKAIALPIQKAGVARWVIIDQVCISIHGFLKRRRSGLCPSAAFDCVNERDNQVWMYNPMPPTNSMVA